MPDKNHFCPGCNDMTTAIQELEDLLNESAASDGFKEEVRQLKQGKKTELIAWNPGAPPVKVLRAISKLLEAEPGLIIESVNIQASSGCSDFVGTLDVNGGEVRFSFVWDCSWRAKQEKFTDTFGYPDQIRASREFGYQCFKKFERVA